MESDSQSPSAFPLGEIDPLGLRQRDAEDLEEEASGRARAIVYRLGRSTLVTKAVGHPGLAHAELLIRRSDALIARVGTIEIFHEWFGVTGYKSEVRTRMTPWARATTKNHAGIHIGTASSIVRMGVTMVQLISGAPILAYGTRTQLEEALARTLRTASQRPP
jgi:hypothetical protein